MRHLILAIVTTLASLPILGTPSAAHARQDEAQEATRPDITGSWDGSANVLGQKLRTIFKVARDDDDNLTATITIPAQMVTDAPIDGVTLRDGKLTFTWSLVNAEWELDLAEDAQTAEGVLKQNGMEFPVTLRHLAEDELDDLKPKRPQTPEPPFPYATAEVEFRSATDNTKLVGTICTPSGEGPHPGVIFITGSGPQDRDETIFDHKPFLVLADDLARHGIASLRYDDRGVGGSEGDLSQATIETFKGDVLAAMATLKAAPGIDPERIGLIGHSEGGIVAPGVAAESDDVAFIVLLAGTGVTGEEVLKVQLRALLEASGVPQSIINRQLADQHKTLELLRDPDRSDELSQHMRTAIRRQMPNVDEEALEEIAQAQTDMVTSPWFRSFVLYDPRPALRKTTCPVLAINGSKDLQVVPSQNLPEILKALEEAGNERVTIHELPGLNHMFQDCVRGTVDEYALIDETMKPRVIEMIRDWIRSTTGLTGE